MASYIKLDGQWKEIIDAYRKVNGEWVIQTDPQASILQSNIYFYSEVKIDDEVVYVISGVSEFTGKSFNLTYIYKNHFLRLFKFNSYKLITFLLYTLNIYIRKAYKKFSKNNFLGTNFRKHLNNNFHENYY